MEEGQFFPVQAFGDGSAKHVFHGIRTADLFRCGWAVVSARLETTPIGDRLVYYAVAKANLPGPMQNIHAA